MSMSGFLEILGDQMQLSDEAKAAFMNVMRKEELEKGHLLVKPGTICNSIYFIEKGLSRTYYNKSGKDITDWFSPEKTIACSIVSLITRKPDRRGIELLESSIIWILDYTDMENLCSQHHEIEK